MSINTPTPGSITKSGREQVNTKTPTLRERFFAVLRMILAPGNIAKDQSGQAMLEFAGSIVIIVLLYLVIITIGLRIEDLSAVNKAARDGGRQTAITSVLADGAAKAHQTAWSWGLEPSRFAVNMSKSAYGARNIVICETSYRSSPFAKMFPTMTGNTPVDEKELKAISVFGWWDVED